MHAACTYCQSITSGDLNTSWGPAVMTYKGIIHLFSQNLSELLHYEEPADLEGKRFEEIFCTGTSPQCRKSRGNSLRLKSLSGECVSVGSQRCVQHLASSHEIHLFFSCDCEEELPSSKKRKVVDSADQDDEVDRWIKILHRKLNDSSDSNCSEVPGSPVLEKEEESVFKHKDVTVLVVDDNPVVLNIGQKMFEKMGVSKKCIVTATNGEQALRYCQTHPKVSLALMDYEMPLMNGLEASSAIRALPMHKDLPIVMNSSRTDSKEKFETAIKNEVISAFLPKPVQLQTLQSICEDIFNIWLQTHAASTIG